MFAACWSRSCGAFVYRTTLCFLRRHNTFGRVDVFAPTTCRACDRVSVSQPSNIRKGLCRLFVSVISPPLTNQCTPHLSLSFLLFNRQSVCDRMVYFNWRSLLAESMELRVITIYFIPFKIKLRRNGFLYHRNIKPFHLGNKGKLKLNDTFICDKKLNLSITVKDAMRARLLHRRITCYWKRKKREIYKKMFNLIF